MEKEETIYKVAEYKAIIDLFIRNHYLYQPHEDEEELDVVYFPSILEEEQVLIRSRPPTPPPQTVNGPWVVRNVPGGVFGLVHHPVYCYGVNEVYQHCEAHCDQMCDGSNKLGLPCEFKICLAGCNCKPGFARDDNDRCIKITECPRPKKDNDD